MIKIVTLVENTKCDKTCGSKHGLSFYIETKSHKILFDVGPNDLYYKNAKKLGINIEDVDTLILSHGHFDHAGGLNHFLKINKKAKIYARLEAFHKHYTKFLFLKLNIGIDCVIDNNRFVITEKYSRIDDEIQLFSGVTGRKLFSYMNGPLLAEVDGRVQRDRFDHEQYLILRDGEDVVLMTGCSHNGIVNIMEVFDQIAATVQTNLLAVIGGFHLYNPVTHEYESKQRIKEIAEWLSNRQEKYYTCHCTGKKAYSQLKEVMGDKLNYLATGSKIDF
ncbi:MAG: MBL fold metallo-hydrolase [Bacilli bacterium]|nr:MBL fold metallo-hydrolase [Bacilli bacterium]